MFARAANCSVKDILERIHKIQLLDDISSSSTTTFSFPRKLKSNTQISSEQFTLPTKDEIYEMIEKSKCEAISDAIAIGLLENENKNIELKCDVRSLNSPIKKKTVKKNVQ